MDIQVVPFPLFRQMILSIMGYACEGRVVFEVKMPGREKFAVSVNQDCLVRSRLTIQW